MAPRIDQIETDQVIPKRVDVVIIGGGIVGVCTAMFLAEKGVSVALCEKGHIAGEQSSRNWGWCRKMGRDVAEIPLAIESLRFWERHEHAGRGRDRLPQEGVVYLCETQDDIARHEEWLEHARPYQLDSRLLSAATRWTAAARFRPQVEGRALHAERRPRRAAEGGARHRRRRPADGRHVLTGCAVRGIETSGRQGVGRRDGEGHDRLRYRRGGGGSVVAAVPRQHGHRRSRSSRCWAR